MENWGEFIGIIAAVLGGIWALLQLAFKVGAVYNRLASLENAHKELPCEERRTSMEEHKTDIREMKKMLENNNEILNELAKWAMQRDKGMIEKLAKKASPLKMTKAGEELYKASHSDEALAKMKNMLMDKISGYKPRTKYDIEEAALDVLIKNMNNEHMDVVKNFVYESPDTFTTSSGEEVSFNLFALIKLMSIDLRDSYIKYREKKGEPSPAE